MTASICIGLIRICLPVLWLAGSLSACRPSPASSESESPSTTLTVFAAASLTEAFTEIGQSFEADQAGVSVSFNFGGSQTLRTQLEQGAVADAFASASPKEMEAAIAAGLVSKDAARIFLTNLLIVILPQDNPARLESLEDLARPGLKLVLAAEAVPVGEYSRMALEKMEAKFGAGFKADVLANVVSEEDNVKQVVAKVLLGEADAGIVYASDAAADPELQTIPIPDEFNVVAGYPIAVLNASPQSEEAAAFVDYVLSPGGQATLKKWGFTPVAP